MSTEDQHHGRVMGLDYGTVRIGIAVSDGLRIAAHAHSVVSAENSKLLEQIGEIVSEYDVSLIVVGLPVSLDGKERAPAKGARKLASRVERTLGVAVELYDERFTSKVAQDALIQSGASRAKRRTTIDQVAAAVMLQGYLDHLRLLGQQ